MIYLRVRGTLEFREKKGIIFAQVEYLPVHLPDCNQHFCALLPIRAFLSALLHVQFGRGGKRKAETQKNACVFPPPPEAAPNMPAHIKEQPRISVEFTAARLGSERRGSHLLRRNLRSRSPRCRPHTAVCTGRRRGASSGSTNQPGCLQEITARLKISVL